MPVRMVRPSALSTETTATPRSVSEGLEVPLFKIGLQAFERVVLVVWFVNGTPEMIIHPAAATPAACALCHSSSLTRRAISQACRLSATQF